MGGGLRVEPPSTTDPVDAHGIDGQGAPVVDVETEEVLLVHVMEGSERLVAMIAEAVGDPQVVPRPETFARLKCHEMTMA